MFGNLGKKKSTKALRQTVRIPLEVEQLQDRIMPAAGLSFLRSAIQSTPALAQTAVVQNNTTQVLDLVSHTDQQVLVSGQAALIPDGPTPASPFDASHVGIQFNPDLGIPSPSADPVAQFNPQSAVGGVHILTFNAGDRLQQGKAAIQERLDGTASSDEIFGQALRGAFGVDNGYGVRQDFSKGSFLWSPETGAHFVSRAILALYDNMDHGWMYAVQDTADLAGWQAGSAVGPAPARFNDFYRPLVKETLTIVTSPGNTCVVEGVMRTKWLDLGAGRFGVPLNNRISIYGGMIQDFWFRGMTRGKVPQYNDNNMAAITWHKDVGAHVVIGYNDTIQTGHYDAWVNSGRASANIAGAWGFAKTDEYYVDAKGQGQAAEVVHFANPNTHTALATINADNSVLSGAKSTPLKTILIRDAIYDEWVRRGQINFGIPLDQQQDRGEYLSQRFSHGGPHILINWYKADGHIEVLQWNGKTWVNLPSTQSSGLSVAEPVLAANSNLIAGNISYKSLAPVSQVSSMLTPSLLEQLNQPLTLGLEDIVGLLDGEASAEALTDLVIEDEFSWYGMWVEETTAEAEAAVEETIAEEEAAAEETAEASAEQPEMEEEIVE